MKIIEVKKVLDGLKDKIYIIKYKNIYAKKKFGDNFLYLERNKELPKFTCQKGVMNIDII